MILSLFFLIYSAFLMFSSFYTLCRLCCHVVTITVILLESIIYTTLKHQMLSPPKLKYPSKRSFFSCFSCLLSGIVYSKHIFAMRESLLKCLHKYMMKFWKGRKGNCEGGQWWQSCERTSGQLLLANNTRGRNGRDHFKNYQNWLSLTSENKCFVLFLSQ